MSPPQSGPSFCLVLLTNVSRPAVAVRTLLIGIRKVPSLEGRRRRSRGDEPDAGRLKRRVREDGKYASDKVWLAVGGVSGGGGSAGIH